MGLDWKHPDVKTANFTGLGFVAGFSAYGAIVHVARGKRNGVQLFAKDAQARALYGPWKNIEIVDEWFAIELPLDGTTGSHRDDGYDATQIAAVGVKFAAGGGSSATYDGPIYVDDVDW